jgi:prevent-host-death family protein
MPVINVHEAKTHFARLLERALQGEEIIVAKHGKPLVRLTPVHPNGLEPRRFGRRPTVLTDEAKRNALAPLGEDDLGEWSAR